MDRILNRICVIPDHPVAELDEVFRIIYVKGLGACLYELSNGTEITKMFFEVWASSILQRASIDCDAWRKDTEYIGNAIAIHRKGIRFFSMKYSFFYDVFYLLSCDKGANLKDTFVYDDAYNFLKTYCGPLAKPALKRVYRYFKEDKGCSKIAPSLISHREKNEKILCQEEKRILVVANVSAGKSTLINALVGYRFNKTKTTACTDKLVFIHNKRSHDGITSKNNNGEYCYSYNVNEENCDSLIEAAFHFKSTLGKENICFIDTPGINNADDCTHKQITENIIKKGDYNAVLYVSNCQYFGTNDEHDLLEFLKANVKKPILFVLNQLDVFNPEEDSIQKMLGDYKSDLKKYGFKTPLVIPVSAYVSFLVRLDSSCLTRMEKTKKNNMIELFEDEYYNLPLYIGQGKSTDILDMTGIKILENKIITV